MRYELRATAYDMLDQVHVVVSLYQSPDAGAIEGRQVRKWTATSRGTGTTDPEAWVRAVLLAASEQLVDEKKDHPLGGPPPLHSTP
jgi:hypothetical protein